nr:immunoglobulin light chain junction region [Macaca mulatta]
DFYCQSYDSNMSAQVF